MAATTGLQAPVSPAGYPSPPLAGLPELSDVADVADLAPFFARHAPLETGDRIVVAFSGGPDSSALLLALNLLAKRLDLELIAAHMDHAMDPDSADRASRAAQIAASLEVPAIIERRAVARLRQPGESLEAAARRIRYRFLEQTAESRGARYVATGHHLDDQGETVLLRMLFGSGLAGLGGIAPRRGRIVRPLLDYTKAELQNWLAANHLEASTDPTNLDPHRPRNRIRHHLLAALGDDALSRRLADLAAAANRAMASLEGKLLRELAGPIEQQTLKIERRELERWPAPVRRVGLGVLLARAASRYPPTTAALSELDRQLATAGPVGLDAGLGWRIEESAGTLRFFVENPRPDPGPAPFAYTLSVPGEVRIPEFPGIFSLTRSPVSPWMFQAAGRRVGLSLPVQPGASVTIRSRRPGDRIWPLGSNGQRRLKEVLIDRKVPRHERDRLPLLCVRNQGDPSDRVVWVPGVTIDQRARIGNEQTAWAAELRLAR